MTVLVTGATGTVGRRVVDGLVGAGARVRAMSRSVGGAPSPGVERVRGDLGDAGGLPPEVFADVDRVLVFAAEGGVDGFVAAAAAAGVERFVVLSSLAAAFDHERDRRSPSALHHAAVERSVTSRTDRWTMLRPGTFATNLLSWAWPIRSGAPIRAPFLESAQAPIHEQDVAAVAVATLLDPAFDGRVLPLTGPAALTRRAQIATIGAAIGRPIEAVEVSPDAFRAETAAFIPPPIVTMLLDYWSDTVAEPDRVQPTVEAVLGRPGRTLAEWAAEHRTDFGAPA